MTHPPVRTAAGGPGPKTNGYDRKGKLAEVLNNPFLKGKAQADKDSSFRLTGLDIASIEREMRDDSATPTGPPTGKSWMEDTTIFVRGVGFEKDGQTNVTPTILSKVDRSLLHVENHPLRIIKDKIAGYMMREDSYTGHGPVQFKLIDNGNPAVTVAANFDSVLVPDDHVSRSKNDNYYLNGGNVLRAHTSAHQVEYMKAGYEAFLVAGDVYRRDEIDRSHYPVFHQMEAVRLFSIRDVNRVTRASVYGSHPRTETTQELHTDETARMVSADLKRVLEGLVLDLFGEVECRWVDCYFPFTHPSYELEIFYDGEWLEVLGCGVMEQEILENADVDDKIGWAFGLGLERLAMVLFDIPDIRLFWSEDPRFLEQFSADKPIAEQQFKPYSKYPPCTKDVTFWIPEQDFSENSLAELIRSVAGDLVEEVKQIDQFVHPKTHRESHCYRITYRSMDRNITNDEINALQTEVRQLLVDTLEVELR